MEGEKIDLIDFYGVFWGEGAFVAYDSFIVGFVCAMFVFRVGVFMFFLVDFDGSFGMCGVVLNRGFDIGEIAFAVVSPWHWSIILKYYNHFSDPVNFIVRFFPPPKLTFSKAGTRYHADLWL